VRAGRPWVPSNLDATVPTATATAPGNGALVGDVADAAGRRPDAVAGKPEAPLHRESVERTGAERPIVVGDRLDTDIEGANRAGTPSLLVLTGVCRPADLLRASAGLRPTYVAADLRTGLLDAHPAVRAVDGGWQCRQVAVRVDGTDVTVDGATDDDAGRIDALRALCVAWWAAEVADADDDAVRTAVAAAGW
jgi:hypothetical protein